MRHIIPISGKDSLASAIVQMAIDDTLDYEFLFLDVGMELPETYQWLDMVEQKLNITLTHTGKDLRSVIDREDMLPSFKMRFCTREAKIKPLLNYLKGEPAIQYVGIRYDEQRPTPDSPGSNVRNRYPLVESMFDIRAVYSILQAHGLMPPKFLWWRLWKEIYDDFSSSPVTKKYLDNLKPWDMAYLFSWRSRSNCYMCFYQRLYEWVGLLEHHPNLFDAAEELETTYGKGGTELRPGADFHLLPDYPLRVVRMRKDEIYKAHINKVKRAVIERRNSLMNDEVDLLQLTSCGNYCGK